MWSGDLMMTSYKLLLHCCQGRPKGKVTESEGRQRQTSVKKEMEEISLCELSEQ